MGLWPALTIPDRVAIRVQRGRRRSMLKVLARLCNIRSAQSAETRDLELSANSVSTPSHENGDAATTPSSPVEESPGRAIATEAQLVSVGLAPAPTISHAPDVRALTTIIASLRHALAERDAILSKLCSDGKWMRQGSASTAWRARTTHIQPLSAIAEE